jgi:hypothetical protein
MQRTAKLSKVIDLRSRNSRHALLRSSESSMAVIAPLVDAMLCGDVVAVRRNFAAFAYTPRMLIDAFCAASRQGRLDMVQFLLDLPPCEGGMSDRHCYDVMIHAVFMEQLDILQCLLALPSARGVDLSATENYAFRLAAMGGKLAVVQWLADLPYHWRVNPSANENVALIHASASGFVDIVQLLLDLPLNRGVAAAARDNAPLRAAACNGHVEVVQLLLELPPERGVDPTAGGNDAFRQARRCDRVAVAACLLELPSERGVIVEEPIADRDWRDVSLPMRTLLTHDTRTPLAPLEYRMAWGATFVREAEWQRRRNAVAAWQALWSSSSSTCK